MASRARRIADWWDVALAITGVLAYYAWTWRSVHAFVVAVDHCDILFCDFAFHFYPMGRSLFATRAPVFGFFYPPFAALLLTPFGRLGHEAALWSWGLLQVAAILVLAILPSKELFPHRRRLRVACALLVMTSSAVLHDFKWGQVGAVLTALTLLGLSLRESGKLWLPAALLACAISIKVYPAMVLLLYLFRRDFRFITCCVALIFLFSVAVPVLLLGPQATSEFFLAVAAGLNGAVKGWVWKDPNSQFVGHVAHRLLGPSASAWAALWHPIGIALAAANARLLWKVVRAKLPHQPYWALALSFGSIAFLIDTSWPHYFVFLPVVQSLIGMTLIDRDRSLQRSAFVALIALGISIAAGTWPIVSSIARWRISTWFGAIFFANLGALIACWCLLSAAVAEHSQKRRERLSIPRTGSVL